MAAEKESKEIQRQHSGEDQTHKWDKSESMHQGTKSDTDRMVWIFQTQQQTDIHHAGRMDT